MCRSTAQGGSWCPSRYATKLGLTPGTPLEIDVVDGHLELSAPYEPAKLQAGPNGPVLAATGTPLTDEQLRQTLEAVRSQR